MILKSPKQYIAEILKEAEESKGDVIRINVPTFVRLLELSREEIKDDADIHDIAEICIKISKEKVIEMKDYSSIVDYIKTQ